MPLYSLITLHVFFHSHLLCWGTCLGGKSISQNPVDRRWDPDHAAMFAPSSCDLNRLAWRCFLPVGEEMKVRRCHIRAVGRVLKNFPAPSFHRSSCVHTHTVQYPLQNCVVHENCGAWATKVLTSSGQCLNFKWIKRHLTMWSYLVAIK